MKPKRDLTGRVFGRLTITGFSHRTAASRAFWSARCTSRRDGYHSQCKNCYRLWSIQARYGISATEYDAMLSAQNRRCASCREAFAKGQRIAVDHCHATGTNRALLCGSCNLALGMMKDSPERCWRLWQYAIKHRQLVIAKKAESG